MKKLKKQIEKTGRKIKWVADSVGVSPTLLSMYLSGVRNMPDSIKEEIEKLIE